MKVIRGVTGTTLKHGGKTVFPDWMIGLAHVVEAKLGQTVVMAQFRVYLAAMAAKGGQITYLTLTRIPPGTFDKMLVEATKLGVPLKNIFFLP